MIMPSAPNYWFRLAEISARFPSVLPSELHRLQLLDAVLEPGLDKYATCVARCCFSGISRCFHRVFRGIFPLVRLLHKVVMEVNASGWAEKSKYSGTSPIGGD